MKYHDFAISLQIILYKTSGLISFKCLSRSSADCLRIIPSQLIISGIMFSGDTSQYVLEYFLIFSSNLKTGSPSVPTHETSSKYLQLFMQNSKSGLAGCPNMLFSWTHTTFTFLSSSISCATQLTTLLCLIFLIKPVSGQVKI